MAETCNIVYWATGRTHWWGNVPKEDGPEECGGYLKMGWIAFTASGGSPISERVAYCTKCGSIRLLVSSPTSSSV